MFIHDIRDGFATVELLPEDCLLLARALDAPNGAPVAEQPLYQALKAAYEALATAAAAQDHVPVAEQAAVAWTTIRFGEREEPTDLRMPALSIALEEGHWLRLTDAPPPPFAVGDVVVYDPAPRRAGSGDWVVIRTSGEPPCLAVLRRRATMYGWEVDRPDGAALIDERCLLGPVIGLWRRPERAPRRATEPAPAARPEAPTAA